MGVGEDLYIFFACVLLGGAGGVVYDVFYPVRRLIERKTRKFAAAADVLFFFLFSLVYVAASVVFAFPVLRWYMFAGCMAGLILYLKSFHRILAFFCDMLYNKRKK